MTNPVFAVGDELLAENLNGISTAFTVTVYTGAATWVKPAGCSRVLVEVQGGGGSGGGNQATAAAQVAVGAGGGGGGYSKMLFLASALASSETVDVGTGAAAAGSGAAGNTGNTSRFATGKAYVVSATGGGGGALGLAGTTNAVLGGAGGAGSGGFLNLTGHRGGTGAGVTGQAQWYNFGGASQFAPPSWITAIGATIGNNGILYGGGSSGSVQGASGAAQGSTAGAAGIVVVYNYF